MPTCPSAYRAGKFEGMRQRGGSLTTYRTLAARTQHAYLADLSGRRIRIVRSHLSRRKLRCVSDGRGFAGPQIHIGTEACLRLQHRCAVGVGFSHPIVLSFPTLQHDIAQGAPTGCATAYVGQTRTASRLPPGSRRSSLDPHSIPPLSHRLAAGVGALARRSRGVPTSAGPFVHAEDSTFPGVVAD